MTASVFVTRDGVVHTVLCVNASAGAYMAVVIMVYASVLQDGVVPTVTSKTALAIVMVTASVLMVYVHVNLTGLAHHVTKDYALVYAADMVSANKKMRHVCASTSSLDLHVICSSAQQN